MEPPTLIRGYRIVAIAADCKSAVSDIGGSSPSTPTQHRSKVLNLQASWALPLL